MDPRSFFWVFIIMFTILSFAIGAIIVYSVMTSNIHHPKMDEADEPGH